MPQETIPARSEIAIKDRWDLSKLFPNDEAWEKGLVEYSKMVEKIPSFRGTLGKSVESLAAWCDFMRDIGILQERIGSYSQLRQTEDVADNTASSMAGRSLMVYVKKEAASAWDGPELMAIPDDTMKSFLADPRLKDYRIYLSKILRLKPHVLSEKEERIIAMHQEGEAACVEAYTLFTNADMNFDVVETPEGKRPLTQSTYSVFLEHPDRDLRRRVYETYYHNYWTYRNTLAKLYEGKVKLDVIHARFRNHPSARAMALFSDNVDEKVYDNLVNTIGANLSYLHHYYAIRKRALKVPELRHYDVYVPLAGGAVKKKTPWNEAASLVCEALSPLGSEYTETLKAGLLGRWADRYENRGKRSGAFSGGGFTGDPYILMNYKEDSLRDIFVMAHEGGHSMHTYYSARNNPFTHYDYTIFEAEVASTFNEELLFRFLSERADSPEMKLYLVNKRVDDIIATLYRQTMFAEFESITHNLMEEGTPLGVDELRGVYRTLLQKYFGNEMVLEKESDLEFCRIPHFYNAFYVYKYATGISAALALADRVLSGGEKEREDYFGFLKSGGSRFPMDSLKAAGVDMSTPAPIEAACAAFGRLVDELEKLL